MNAASQYLLALTKHNLQVYLQQPTVKAALIAGSVAEEMIIIWTN